MPTVVENFFATLKQPCDADRATRAAIARWLAAELGEVARKLPEIRADFAVFAEFLAEKIADADAPFAALRALHLADLFLAWTCANGDPTALSLFDREYLSRVRTLARGTDPAELEQAVRVRLLIAEPPSAPRIRQYSGKGPLVAWVRMVATRIAIDLARQAQPMSPMTDDLTNASTPVDPEIDYLKLKYASHFRAAIEQALRSLSAKQATLLKLHYVENAQPSAIARMYTVSSRTVQRWLLEARQSLLERTRSALGEKLAIHPSELDSLMMLFGSHLHVSLERVLTPVATRVSVPPKRDS